MVALPLVAWGLLQLAECASFPTLSLQNVSFAEWFNSGEGNGADQKIKDVLPNRIEARSARAHCEGGQHIAAAVARLFGVVDQTMFNWARANRHGKGR